MLLKISQNSPENTSVAVSSLKETPTQVFSYEFCEIFKNTFAKEHLQATSSKITALLENRITISYSWKISFTEATIKKDFFERIN